MTMRRPERRYTPRRATASPGAEEAAERRDFARYITRLLLDPPLIPGADRDAVITEIAAKVDAMSDDELREEVTPHLDGPRRSMVGQIVNALDAAAEAAAATELPTEKD
jgi:hypothetical protein